jgi:hypothetical protein
VSARLAVVAATVATALAGCEKQATPLVGTSLAAQIDHIYVFRGNPTPVAQAQGTVDDDALVNAVNVPLGGDLTTPTGCKELTVYWLPLAPSEETPTTDRTASMCALMPSITLGQWKAATGDVKIFPKDLDHLEVRIEASRLVPHAVYTAWIFYSVDGKPYAVAPVGGLPNLLLTDERGQAVLKRKVPARMVRQKSVLYNALPLSSPPAKIVDPATKLTFALYYHSSAQSNGNTSLTTRSLLPGRAVVLGQLGVDAHVHLTGELAALP